VKALILAAVGGVASLTPGIITKSRFRLTDSGLSRTPLHSRGEREPKVLFTWEELSHIIPTKSGFKYYKDVPDPNAFRRFGKLHFSDSSSGEVRVEVEDQPRVMDIIRQRGIPTTKLPPLRRP
jgi:hypothetical protein